MMMNPQQMMAMAAASGGNGGANMLGGLPMEVLMNPELFAAQLAAMGQMSGNITPAGNVTQGNDSTSSTSKNERKYSSSSGKKDQANSNFKL